MEIWECWDLGEAKEFLKMRIQWVGNKLILDQQDYLNKIVSWFGLENAKSASTPLPEQYEPEVNKGECTPDFRQQY